MTFTITLNGSFRYEAGQRTNVPTEWTVGEAVNNSLTEQVDYQDGDSDVDHLRRQLDATTQALGQVVAFLIKGDMSDAAKSDMLREVLHYDFRVNPTV